MAGKICLTGRHTSQSEEILYISGHSDPVILCGKVIANG